MRLGSCAFPSPKPGTAAGTPSSTATPPWPELLPNPPAPARYSRRGGRDKSTTRGAVPSPWHLRRLRPGEPRGAAADCQVADSLPSWPHSPRRDGARLSRGRHDAPWQITAATCKTPSERSAGAAPPRPTMSCHVPLPVAAGGPLPGRGQGSSAASALCTAACRDGGSRRASRRERPPAHRIFHLTWGIMRRSVQQPQQPVDGVMDDHGPGRAGTKHGCPAPIAAEAAPRLILGAGDPGAVGGCGRWLVGVKVSMARHGHGHREGVEWDRLPVQHGFLGEAAGPWSPASSQQPQPPVTCPGSVASPQRRHGRPSPQVLDTADPLPRSPAAPGRNVQTRAGPSGPSTPCRWDGSHARLAGMRDWGRRGVALGSLPYRAGQDGQERPRPFLALAPAGMLEWLLPRPCPVLLMSASGVGRAVPFSSSSYTLTPCRQWFWGSRVVLDRTLVSPVTLSFSTVISTEYMAGTQRGQRALRPPRPSPAPAQRPAAGQACGGSGAVRCGAQRR